MSLFGVIALLFPLFSSLDTSEYSSAKFPRVNIKNLNNNEYFYVKVDASNQRNTNEGSTVISPGTSWLVIKDNVSNFYVYEVPIWEENVLMPYKHWYQFEGECSSFGPEKLNGKITSASKIVCKDKENKFSLYRYWFWSITGENISGKLPDMMSIPFKLEINDLVLYKG